MARKNRNRLPEIADWIVEGKIAAMSMPYHDDLRRLKESGFELVVNLTEKPGPTSMATAAGLRGKHIPVPDMTAPEEEQIEEFVHAVERCLAGGKRVAVHCMGGVGRTGTMIACYLVKSGMGPWAAIDEVRRRRPGSIQTQEQEGAVVRYARVLRGRG